MNRPSPDQLAAACGILKQFTRVDGATATDTRLSHCVYSIISVLGGPGSPAAEYTDVIAAATGGAIDVNSMVRDLGDGVFFISADNPFGIPEGVYYPEAEAEASFDDTPDDTPDALPDEAALKAMTKKELIEQAQKENLDMTLAKTNDERVQVILAARKQE